MKIEKPENYDSMSPEEKIKFFEKFEFDDNSAKIKALEETVNKLKDSVSNANSQAAEWKKKHNALLSEEERTKLEREEEMQQLRDALKAAEEEKENAKRETETSKSTAKYISLGYSPELAESTAKALAAGDVVTVIANQATFNKSLEDKIKADMMKSTPSPKTGGNTEITKEQFDKMDYSERAKLFAENRGLYDALNAE